MFLKILKWTGWVALITSGVVFYYAPLAGFYMALFGGGAFWCVLVSEGVADVRRLREHHSRLLGDRHRAHTRVANLGDFAWLADELGTIAERDAMPEDIKANVRGLKSLVAADAFIATMPDESKFS